MGSPQLSVIVVNYRHYDLLKACLRSVYASRLRDYEVIVVDHATNAQQVADLKREFPDILIEGINENPGYASGNNMALELSTGEFVFILNNDVTVDPTVSNDVLREFRAHQEIATLQPMIVLQQDPERMNNCGLDVQYLGYAWDRCFKQLRSSCASAVKLNAFSGAAVVLRKSAVDTVGRFDENYFLYHEDVDLSLRLRNAGFVIKYTPTLLVYHHYSFKSEPWRYFYLERNRWFTVIKNYPWSLIILSIPAALFMELGVFTYSVFKGWSKEKVRAWGAVIRALPRLVQLRHRNGKTHITTKEFVKGMKGGVVFAEVNSPLLRYVANPLLGIYWLLIRIIVGSSAIFFIKNERTAKIF